MGDNKLSPSDHRYHVEADPIGLRGGLVLTRKRGEGIRIGDDVEIFIISISANRNSARILIRAPRERRVLRIGREEQSR